MADYSKSLLDEPDHNVMVMGKIVEVGDDSYVGGGIQLVSRPPPSQEQEQQNYHHEQHYYHEEQRTHQSQHPQPQPQQPFPPPDPQRHDNIIIHRHPEKIKSGINYNRNKKGRISRTFWSRIARYCKGSILLAFLSHLCFVIASLFYIKLSFVQLEWIKYTMVENDLTTEILNTDDDVVWSTWANENQGEYREPPTYLQLTRLTYGDDYTMWCTRGAAFFVLVGILDWLRYCDKLNIFMILAGLAGVLSGYSESTRAAAVWDAISVHLYFLESITLLKRVHYYPDHASVMNSNMSMVSGTTVKQKDNGIVDVGDHYLESSGSGGVNGVCSSGGMDASTIYIYENEVDDSFPCFRVGDLFFFLGSMLDVSVV